jgi:hypothetical protein
VRHPLPCGRIEDVWLDGPLQQCSARGSLEPDEAKPLPAKFRRRHSAKLKEANLTHRRD